MNLDTIYEDSNFSTSVVPQGYLLTFIGYSDGVKGGDIVKRYKDSDGNFGVLLGGSSGMSDEEAYALISASVSTAESALSHIYENKTLVSSYKDALTYILGG